MKKSQELTLRDYFASCALSSVTRNELYNQSVDVAKRCYELADAMLEERNKEKG